MNCQQFARFVDGSLVRERGGQEAQEARLHADRCLSCAEHLRVALELEGALSEMPHVTPPADFTGDVMARVAQEPAVRATETPASRSDRAYWAAVLTGMFAFIVGMVIRARSESWLDGLSRLASLATGSRVQQAAHAFGLASWIAVLVVGVLAYLFVLRDDPADRVRRSSPS